MSQYICTHTAAYTLMETGFLHYDFHLTGSFWNRLQSIKQVMGES